MASKATKPAGEGSVSFGLQLGDVMALLKPLVTEAIAMDPAKAKALRVPEGEARWSDLQDLAQQLENVMKRCRKRIDERETPKVPESMDAKVKALEKKVSAEETLHNFLFDSLNLCDELLDVAPLTRAFSKILATSIPTLETQYRHLQDQSETLADLVPPRFFSTLHRLKQHPVRSGYQTPRTEVAAPPVGLGVPEDEEEARPEWGALPMPCPMPVRGRLLRLVLADFKNFERFLMASLHCLHDASRELNILLPWDRKPQSADLPTLGGVVLLFKGRVQSLGGAIATETKFVPPLIFAATAAEAILLEKLSDTQAQPASTHKFKHTGSGLSLSSMTDDRMKCIVDFDESLTLDIDDIKADNAKADVTTPAGGAVRTPRADEDGEPTVQVSVDFYMLFLTHSEGEGLPPLLTSSDEHCRWAAGGTHIPFPTYNTKHYSIDEEKLGSAGRLEWLCRWEANVDISEVVEGYLDLRGRPSVVYLADSEHLAQTSATRRAELDRKTSSVASSKALKELDRLATHVRTAMRRDLGGRSRMPSLRLCLSSIPPTAIPPPCPDVEYFPVLPGLLPPDQRKVIRLQILEAPTFPDHSKSLSAPLRPFFIAQLPRGSTWTSPESSHQGLRTGRHISGKASVQPGTSEGEEISYVHHGEVSLSRTVGAVPHGPTYRWNEIVWLPYTPEDSYVALDFFAADGQGGHAAVGQPVAFGRLPVDSLAMGGGDEWQQWGPPSGGEGEVPEAEEDLGADASRDNEGTGRIRTCFLCPLGEVRYRLSLVGLGDVPTSIAPSDVFAVHCEAFESRFTLHQAILDGPNGAQLSNFVKCSVTFKLGNDEVTVLDGGCRTFHSAPPTTTTARTPMLWVCWPSLNLTFPLNASHFGGPLELEVQVRGHFDTQKQQQDGGGSPTAKSVRKGSAEELLLHGKEDTTTKRVLGRVVVPLLTAGGGEKGGVRGMAGEVKGRLKETTGQWLDLTDGIWATPTDDKKGGASCRCHNLSLVDVRSSAPFQPVTWDHLPTPLAPVLNTP
ncbi:unnamed protein product [Vitrella brassicaformis CCMP3155]|uniref:Uncharacterized protein n=2 Tax=Vitrella brassicaformis TaxID=1169539 RepID=A0A0G4EZB9_VITBC|nr:unnamed protein product [Vitrella brassicaformis CCMP3155]|eukprot:CEM04127.1 unnamed protein product [Vitrella brassicaformis CCMP3155]